MHKFMDIPVRFGQDTVPVMRMTIGQVNAGDPGSRQESPQAEHGRIFSRSY
jgi:hypothetical protein